MASKSNKSTKKTSNNKTASKIIKSGKKMAKKNPKGFIALVIILVVLVALGVGGFFAYRYFVPSVDFKLIGKENTNVALDSTYKEKGVVAKYNGKDISNEVVISYYLGDAKQDSIKTNVVDTVYTVKYDLNYQRYTGQLERKVKIVEVESIDINFLELGNDKTGDCTFIKAGDTDILIDAGSRQASATTIDNFVKGYCDDGVLEYVIATHAHQDHIEGFTSTNTNPGIFDRYKIDTLIDFAKTNNEGKTLYEKYKSLRDAKIASGDIAHHYTAAECIVETNGASKVYEIAAGITMEIHKRTCAMVICLRCHTHLIDGSKAVGDEFPYLRSVFFRNLKSERHTHLGKKSLVAPYSVASGHVGTLSVETLQLTPHITKDIVAEGLRRTVGRCWQTLYQIRHFLSCEISGWLIALCVKVPKESGDKDKR